MKRRANDRFPTWSTMVLLLTLVASLIGSVPNDAAAQGTAGRLPLWEVTRDGQSIHLLGSVHVLAPEAYPLHPALYRALDQAAVIVFEVDLEAGPDASRMLMSAGMLPADESLSEILPADVYEELNRRIGSMGLMPAIERMEPWLVALTITTIATQQAGFQANLGVDAHLYARSVEQGKRIAELESVADQIAVFEGLPVVDQITVLRSTLAEMDQAAERMHEATEIWAAGDVERLAAMMNEAMSSSPVFMERVLYERNRAWIPRIEAFFESGEPTLVVVGMGHMVGEGSVTDLLRERGFEVSQVDAAVVR